MTGPDRHVAAHGQRTLLAYRAFELAFVHADEHDAGFTLSGDQIDHLDGDAGRVHAQANHQHLGHLAAAGAHRRVRGPQQREHRDRGDVVDQSLLEFGRYRRLRHEQSLRQRALLLGNRRRGRQPSVRADTSPQCATVRCAAVIIGLLVFASGGRPACAHCSNPQPHPRRRMIVTKRPAVCSLREIPFLRYAMLCIHRRVGRRRGRVPLTGRRTWLSRMTSWRDIRGI